MPENPILAVLNPFLTSSGFKGQLEKLVRGAKNKGFQNSSFEAMMKKVGWRNGEAWCMYFCKLVYMQFYSFDRDFIAKNFTGSSQGTPDNIIQLNRKGDNKYVFIDKDTPQIGDIFILKNNDRSYQGHAGIVTEVLNNNLVKTIEGNTNLGGSREGDGVFELTRTMEVGKASKVQGGGGTKILRGYIRRNFTEQELSRLFYDENEKTLKFVVNISNVFGNR